MNSVKDIVEWAVNDLTNWESDIVRRLLENQTLSEEDLKEVINNVTSIFGIAEAGEQRKCIAPVFTSESIDDALTPDPIKLCGVHTVENVNAIHNGSILPFSHQGITLIYGENGSGKSGYTRILKSACFAKHIDPEILPNIYKSGSRPQSAKISFIKNGERIHWDWSPGKTLSELSAINVYDSDCGKVLLEKNNQVTYKPKGVEIFDSVSSITEEIKNAVSGKAKLAQLPVISGIEDFPNLKAWLNAINDKTPIQSIESKLIWPNANQAELDGLSVAIQEYENGTTVKKLEKLKTIIDTRLPRAITKLSNCIAILSNDKAKFISELKASVKILKTAHNLAVAKFDTAEPLDGIHSEAWKLLFNAAKEYSEGHAYVGTKFPKIENDSLCVLCMQPLATDAKDRLSRFDSYITDKSKTRHDQAANQLKEVESAIEQLNVPDQEAYEPLCHDLVESLGIDHGLAAAFKLIKRRKEFFDKVDTSIDSYPTEDTSAKKLFDHLLNTINQKILELQATISLEKHTSNISRHSELSVTRRLHESKDLIIQYQQSLAFNNKISDVLAAIRSTKQKFSTKAKSIISQLVTPDFISNFKSELEFMGVSLDVKISPVVRDLDTSHSFTIATKRPGKVLSEGEQKVISLSAFLAEIKTFRNSAPIILDDPVSSLDHMYREKIAERLAKEALTRQVIVFTHDLSLIMEVEGKCDDIALSLGKGPARSTFTIRRNGKDSGFCYSKAPWRGMSTSQRAQSLDEDVHSIKSLYESDRESYNQKAALIYCLLREAWESLVEQDLFCQIVTRGRNSVQTLRLDELKIESTDANIITLNMAKTSNWMFGHDKSRALTENRPAPTDILEDIAKLRAFSKELIGRRKPREKVFEEQLKPPACEVG